MSVRIETCYQVKMDASTPWKVAMDSWKLVEGEVFVKLKPYEQSFVQLVCHDLALELPKYKKKLSLANCEGFKALVKLRNDVAASLEQSEADAENADDAKTESLFGKGDETEAGNKKIKKVPRMNAARLQSLREFPELMDVSIPGGSERPSLLITFIRPAHPCDEMCVKLEPDSIAQIVHFIRDQGVDADDLQNRRSYGNIGAAPGVWKNGSAGLIRKINRDEEDDPDGCCSKKYKTLKGSGQDDAGSLPVDDAEPVANGEAPGVQDIVLQDA